MIGIRNFGRSAKMGAARTRAVELLFNPTPNIMAKACGRDFPRRQPIHHPVRKSTKQSPDVNRSTRPRKAQSGELKMRGNTAEALL